jgi:hypothetical protein
MKPWARTKALDLPRAGPTIAGVFPPPRESPVRRRTLLVLGLTLPLAACVAPGTRQDELLITIRSYEGAVRWGRIEGAYEFLKPDPDNPVEIPQGLDQIKVTGYDRLTPVVPTDEEKHRFRVTSAIRYVHLDRQVERNITDQQVWEWDAEAKRWWRANPIPAFP